MINVEKKAFSLVELLIAVIILAVLAAVAIPRITGGSKSAKINACKTNVKAINTQIEIYYTDKGAWPADIRNVTDNPNCFPDGPPVCPFGLDYDYDTLKHRVRDHSH